MRILATLVLSLIAFGSGPALAAEDHDTFLEFARRGWYYELRSAMWRRTPDMPPIVIHGRALSGAALCIIGEPPHPATAEILKTFSDLMLDVSGKPVPMRHAGPDLDQCGTRRTVYLRLYSGARPHREYNRDIRRLNAIYGLGFRKGRNHTLLSPGQAQTFFGQRGQVTHIAIKQPDVATPTALQERFFSSILVEELYQSFTFGMDILHFDPKVAFVSKLEEIPANLMMSDWDSEAYMEGILRSNPDGLCLFDVFMLHAVATAPVERTNDQEFLDFIAGNFAILMGRTERSWRRLAGNRIIDPTCGAG